jgi:phage recombination protein Bet
MQDLTIYQGRASAPAPTAYSDADLEALKSTVAKDCSEPQFKVFMGACRRLGLDPFARQITPIVQGGRMTPQITIDGFRLIAQRTGQYAGQLGPQWCGPDGEWKDVWLSDKPPAAARVAVLRRDFAEPMWGVARFASYRKGGTWDTMPDVMIAKVAESLALRKAFPQELSGVYSDDEMGTAEPPPVVRSGGHLVEVTTGEVVDEARPVQPVQPIAAKKPNLPALINTLQRRCNELGLTVDEREDVCQEVLGKLGIGTIEEYHLVAARVAQLERDHDANKAAHARVPADALQDDEAGVPA